MFKSIAATLVLVGSMSSFAMDEKVKAEADSKVKQACSVEITTAGCSDKSVGTGLLKCLQSYKKEHKEFKFSEGCKNVRKDMKENRKEKKAAKAAATSEAPVTK